MSARLRALLFVGLALAASACGGGGGSGGPPAPSNLTYASSPALYRQGEAIPANEPSVLGEVDSYSVTPGLPANLMFDSTTGFITGTPTATHDASAFLVTATGPGGSTNFALTIDVGPPLPSAVETLPLGFVAEVVLEGGPQKIAKIAPAPDGRLFFVEVDTGLVRIVDAGGFLLPTAFATIGVANGGHRGLLALALDPAFAVNGYVYVVACVPGDGMATPDRQQLIRYTDVANLGMNQTIVWDDLPISAAAGPTANINNGGELVFGTDGSLFMSLGDVDDPSTAQAGTGTSLAGKVLRFLPTTPVVAIPGDNPTMGDAEWCRGLRNTFGLAVHPTTGGLFGVDNGPAANDELNFLDGGKNFEWGSGGGIPGPQLGFKMRNYATVVVPTALCWHDGSGWGAEFANSLFMTTYDEYALRRFVLSGPAFTDVDSEEIWAVFDDGGGTDANRPLDVARHGSSGDLYVSTFNGIYRFRRQ